MNRPGDRSVVRAAIEADLAQVEGGLVVACSGGLDSTVLVHALARLEQARLLGLKIIHVDHGLHPDSGAWAEQVRQLCASLDLPLIARRCAVLARGDGPEAAARRARWQVFSDLVASGDVLTLAHHRDDQAETVLLRLLRGAGPTGLAAMPVWSTRRSGLRVWRPLLSLPRSELLAYARHHGLRWIEDPSNAEPGYARNWLRHQLVPMLRQRWPQVDASLAQVADRQRQAARLEQQVGRRLLAAAATPDPNVLRIPPLLAAAPEQRHAALRLWLQPLAIGAARLQRIDRELLTARSDSDSRIELLGSGSHALPRSPTDRLAAVDTETAAANATDAHEIGKAKADDGDTARVLRRHGDELHLLPLGADRPLHYDLRWDGRTTLSIAGVGRLRLHPAPDSALSLQVRHRQGGERLRLHPQRPRQRLKHLLQEAGLPPWLRARWPVLWLDGEVAGFADLLIGESLRERLKAMGCSLHFDPD